MADSDGQQIMMLLLYLFSKYARFLIELGCVYVIVSPLFYQDGKYFYPGDPMNSNNIPIGLNQNRPFSRYKGLGGIDKDKIYDVFYNPNTRKLVQITPEGLDLAMSLTEDINVRKKLLINAGIITNPFKLKD